MYPKNTIPPSYSSVIVTITMYEKCEVYDVICKYVYIYVYNYDVSTLECI